MGAFRVRIGIFAKTFSRPSLEGVLDAVIRHDLYEAQLNMSVVGLPSMPDEIDPALADRVREAAADRNIAVVAVSGTFNMIHPDPEVRLNGLRRLGVLAGACERLGTPQGDHRRREPLRRRRPRTPALTLGGDPGRGLRAPRWGAPPCPRQGREGIGRDRGRGQGRPRLRSLPEAPERG